MYSPDIICVVESWLDSDITDSEISIQGFSIIRLDRCRHGGGVLMYVKTVFTCSLLFKGTTDFEFIVISILCTSSGTSPDLTVAIFYRPPNSNPTLLDSLFTTLCNLDVSVFSNFYLLGDFNIDFFCASNPLYHKLLSIVSSFNLEQVVTEPTRVFKNSATLIDLIFVSSPAQVESCLTTPPLANSDHNGLQLTASIKAPKRLERIVPRKFWKYSIADFDAITNCLDNVDWNLIFTGDVDTCWSNWRGCFMQIMDLCIPNSTVTPSRRVPWMNHAVMQAIRKRKSLFRIFKRTGNPLDLTKYNRVVALLRERREEFFHNLNTASVKDFWKAIRKLSNKQSTIPTLLDGGTPVDSSQGKAIANLLNNFFFGCFNRQCSPLDTSPSPAGIHYDLNPSDYPCDLLCTVDSVADLLANLDISKSSGVDDISARMLKSTAYSIAPSLTELFNLSLTSGTFPSEWKLARVVPIPKTDTPSTSTSGYRPISILPIVSKVLERHVKEIIDVYLAENSPISNHQWGFMHHRSSTSALISVIHDWLNALNNGHEVCVVFFDVRKAFDSVPHIPLLQKLSDIGLNPFILRWIKSYLTNRKQFVVVDGSSSTPLQVLSGVPQGSVLGPLLFIIYINDVVSQISGGSKINLFADDIALYRIINSADDYERLQDDINAVSSCLAAKHLNLNSGKCCYLLLSRKRALSIPPPTLLLNGDHLVSVASYKYLGVLITSNLMWSSHITNVCNKTRRLIGILYRRFAIPPQTYGNYHHNNNFI